MNKRKIINDPVYGFITIPTELIFDLIEHPFFQRLGRIKQLGLTYLVYPGAQHTRLQHALGAMHLMAQSLEVLRSKGANITNDEAEAVTIAILLHDIGHGPFSHTLEKLLVTGISHEELSIRMMEKLNAAFEGKLSMALEIFRGNYNKTFLHQLVSSQLDMDRLDYLNRDSFFTGVAEGVIGYDRIIKMLTVKNNELMVESKGMYSIEKFLISRRLMYWQVYLHKTVLAAEQMLVKIMERANEISVTRKLAATPALSFFLEKKTGLFSESTPDELLTRFADLDDTDVISSIKMWRNDEDPILSWLSRHLLLRKLFKIELRNTPFEAADVAQIRQRIHQQSNIDPEDLHYFVFMETTTNHAYSPESGPINILFKDGSVKDVADASDLLNIRVLEDPVVKHFLCYPKELV
ncbi:MAG TPA: HD domain-containing protein [Chitinophagales bacterium]|nr:HD domain-containing protein [Chitinophagales bacterium]